MKKNPKNMKTIQKYKNNNNKKLKTSQKKQCQKICIHEIETNKQTKVKEIQLVQCVLCRQILEIQVCLFFIYTSG